MKTTMKKVIIYLKNKLLKNKDKAQIEIGPLQMLLEKNINMIIPTKPLYIYHG